MAKGDLGDFQTPSELAVRVVALVAERAGRPSTIIEPTCGRGNFIAASLEAFPEARVHGLELQPRYIAELERRFQFHPRFVLHHADYFGFDWPGLLDNCDKPLWVIGNPPWVTNTQLTKLNSTNLPAKTPQRHLRGIEAQTGKSNFDISEAMVRDWFVWCAGCGGSLAVVCKTSVARKLLHWWWKRIDTPPNAAMYLIDAKETFNATVSACVLICSFGDTGATKSCAVHDSLSDQHPSQTIGFVDGHLVADHPAYLRGRALLGTGRRRWRSGIKHDAADALELRRDRGGLRTKAGQLVDLEADYIFPLLKGSDLARDTLPCDRAMLVPQTVIGEDMRGIEHRAPRTWRYLQSHTDVFARRKSVIYSKGGAFSIFGVGEYSFCPWKVAIAALYKKLNFRLIGPIDGRPVVFDDTVYFLGFGTEDSAREALERLHCERVTSFLQSMIFWDDMRPVKTDILNRIDLALAA
jgi:hypothetical protein